MTIKELLIKLAQLGIFDARLISYSGSWTIYTWQGAGDTQRRLEAAGFVNVQTWISTDDLDTLGMTVAMFDEQVQFMDIYQRNGFESAKEAFHLIASADLSTPEKFAAFLRWRDEDGSKAGLLKLLENQRTGKGGANGGEDAAR